MSVINVTVWVCPTVGCGNYYAASSAEDLSEWFNTDLKGVPTHSRAQCPDCNLRGLKVDRKPVVLKAQIPKPEGAMSGQNGRPT